MMEQYTEHDLEQQAVALKRQGRSVRQIAEVLGISPSKAYRLTKMDDGEPAGETEAETPQHDTLDALERTVAHALLSEDTEHLTTLLGTLQERERIQAAHLAELRTAQTRAEAAL